MTMANPKNRRYTDHDYVEIDKLMGKVSDKELSTRFGPCSSSIGERRRRMNIPAYIRPDIKVRKALCLPHNDVDRYLFAMFKPLAARYGK